RKVLQQDDMRLFRLTDLLLLSRTLDVDELWKLATSLNWRREVARAMRYLNRLFATDIHGGEDPVRERDLIATPDGLGPWPWAFEERIRRVDRAEWLSRALGAELGARTNWYSSLEGSKYPTNARAGESRTQDLSGMEIGAAR